MEKPRAISCAIVIVVDHLGASFTFSARTAEKGDCAAATLAAWRNGFVYSRLLRGGDAGTGVDGM